MFKNVAINFLSLKPRGKARQSGTGKKPQFIFIAIWPMHRALIGSFRI